MTPSPQDNGVTEPGPDHQKALDLFLSERPELATALEHLNPLQAQVLDLTMKAYRQEHLNEAFEAEAERLGLFAWELTLQLTSPTPQAYEAQRLEVHREVAQMAGLSWAEYCEVYGIEDGTPPG